METNRRNFIKGITGTLIATYSVNELERRKQGKPMTHLLIPDGENFPLEILHQRERFNITDLELLLAALSSTGINFLHNKSTSRRKFFKIMLQLGIGASLGLSSTAAELCISQMHPNIDRNIVKEAAQGGLNSNVVALAYRGYLAEQQRYVDPYELINMPITKDYIDSEGYQVVELGQGNNKITVVFGNQKTKHRLILPHNVAKAKDNLNLIAVAVSPTVIQKSNSFKYFVPAGAVSSPFLNYNNRSFIEIKKDSPDEIQKALQNFPAPLVSWLNGLYPIGDNPYDEILNLHNEFIKVNSPFREYHYPPPIGSGVVYYEGRPYTYQGPWGIHRGEFYGTRGYSVPKDNTLQGFGIALDQQGNEIPFLISGGPFSIYKDTLQAYEVLKKVFETLGYYIIEFTTSDTGSSSVIFSNERRTRTSHTPSSNLHHQIAGAIGF